MAKRREADGSKYTSRLQLTERDDPPNSMAVLYKLPTVVCSLGKSTIKQAEEKPDWRLYRVEYVKGNPVIVREMCDRCGKVFIVPKWRKMRAYNDKELGIIYLETGVCKDCINASLYVDRYLDGVVLSETEAKAQFYRYGMEYERAWRVVIAAAPRIAITEAEWKHRVNFFQGCAICGGNITVQGRFFPRKLNGELTAWNVIPMCDACMEAHYRGKTDISKKVYNCKVFSTHEKFQKTKTIRMYLLNEMQKHGIYMEPLDQWRKRFFETKVLPGSE